METRKIITKQTPAVSWVMSEIDSHVRNNEHHDPERYAKANAGDLLYRLRQHIEGVPNMGIKLGMVTVRDEEWFKENLGKLLDLVFGMEEVIE